MKKELLSPNLTNAVQYAFKNSRFYQLHFKNHGELINSLDKEKFNALPFTTKEDMAEDNNSFCCVSKEEIADYVTTSGTQGHPITIYLTKEDLDRLAENERASLMLMNGSRQDLYQLMITIDKQFMAGLAYYLGIVKMGAGIIRIGPGSIPEQWNSIINNKPNKLIAVPSYISRLITYAEENNIDYKNSSINSIICLGEPIRNNDFSINAIGKSITDRWDVMLYSTYASTEMATAFSECKYGNGGHFNNDLIYCEVLDENDKQVKNGETGEIVITTLQIKGTPLVRYRTGDIATFWNSTCKCRNPASRIGPILGRKNQLIKYKGTTIYPQTIFNAIKSIDPSLIFQIDIFESEITTENIVIKFPIEQTKHLTKELIIDHIQSLLKVKPEIQLIPKIELEKSIYIKNKRKPQIIRYIKR